MCSPTQCQSDCYINHIYVGTIGHILLSLNNQTMKVLFLYFNLCLRVLLDSLFCSFTFISFLTTWTFTLICDQDLVEIYSVSAEKITNDGFSYSGNV